MTEHDSFLMIWEREFQTTLKVMRAYPADKLDLKPAEKLRTARDLMWVFIGELFVLQMAMSGKIDMTGEMPPAPETLDELCSIFEQTHNAIGEIYRSKTAEELNSTMVQFPVGPGKSGDFRTMDVAWITVYSRFISALPAASCPRFTARLPMSPGINYQKHYKNDRRNIEPLRTKNVSP
jgi:hypothetical protein